MANFIAWRSARLEDSKSRTPAVALVDAGFHSTRLALGYGPLGAQTLCSLVGSHVLTALCMVADTNDVTRQSVKMLSPVSRSARMLRARVNSRQARNMMRPSNNRVTG